MPDYLPWNQSDLENVERALKRYKALGFQGSVDLKRSGEGIVTLSRIDGRVAHAPIVIFEVHKLKRNDTTGRAHWVVAIQSLEGPASRRHGCVSAGSSVFAIAKAEKDADSGFVAKDSFDMAANAYWLKP